jgi:DNA replication protein DnaC
MKPICPACHGLGYLVGRPASPVGSGSTPPSGAAPASAGPAELGTRSRADDERAQARLCACQATCGVCRGTRFRIVRDGAWDVAVPCDCGRLIGRIRAFNAAGLPAAYAEKTLSPRGPDDPRGFHDRRLASLVRAKLLVTRYQQLGQPVTASSEGASGPSQPARGLVLVGGPGLGKTHLVSALISHLTLERGIACRFVDYYQLLASIRATFDGKGPETEASILAPLIEVPVLVLDDLGKGQATPWEWTIVDQLITRRYNAGRVVIATTNFLLAEDLDRRAQQPQAGAWDARRRRVEEALEDRIGDRLVSRLRETCEFCLLEGSDFRPQLAARR